MPIRAVLFDLDGTLLDRRETFRHHLECQLWRQRDAFPPGVAPRYVSRLLELDENGTLDRDTFHRHAETEFGLAAGSGETLKADFERHFPECCFPLPNLDETLESLREAGVKLGMITNGRALIQNRKIDALGVRPYFETIVISEDAGVRKPDPRIFAMALDPLGVDAASAAYVGDHPEADVFGARQSGLVAIWRRDPFFEEPVDVDHVIDDLSELVAIVAGEGGGA